MWEEEQAFRRYLIREEREKSTIEKYLRDVRRFLGWLQGRAPGKEEALQWRESLYAQHYSAVTVNAMLAAVNRYFLFLGKSDCRIKYLRVQHRLFRGAERNLTREEYLRLVEAAYTRGKARLGLLLESICSTGIRVSEVRYLTVEAISAGQAEVAQKGKIRTILLPGRLCRKLFKYVRKQKIASGEIFITRSGKGMTRHQIWSEMKSLCRYAKVKPSKVFPHNLRHLFAQLFYRACRDVARLADILGHSSMETTRIYLISTGREYTKKLDRLGLIC